MNDLTISYLDRLKLKRATRKALPKPPTLHERLDIWFENLSDDDKHRAWHMKEFRAIFGESPQRIGAALFDLGWTRRRSWADSKPTARFWIKE